MVASRIKRTKLGGKERERNNANTPDAIAAHANTTNANTVANTSSADTSYHYPADNVAF